MAGSEAGGCTSDLWFELASSKTSTKTPFRHFRPGLSRLRKHNEAYREAVGLLRKACALMVRLGRGESRQLPESVRLANKPKRNFMKLRRREMEMIRTGLRCIQLDPRWASRYDSTD